MLNYPKIAVLICLIALPACLPSLPKYPAYSWEINAVLLEETFDTPANWDNYDLQGVKIGVNDGVYRIESTLKAFVWGQNKTQHDNGILQVNARQISVYRRNLYGLMCRASPANDGDGYYFLVSADGYYSIRRGQNRSNVAIVEWEYSNVIQQGRGLNVIRAVCAGDYLALYVNGQFMAEARDTYYRRGYAGLVAALPNEQGDVRIEFDNLFIWEAQNP